MISNNEKNLIFVNYPPGAGGWFLCALVHYLYNPTDEIQFDNLGSGHANKNVRQFNDMYPCGLLSDLGRAIINKSHYDTWPTGERKEFIKAARHPFSYNDLVISLHCADLDLVHETFNDAKFIKINISHSDIRRCRYNLLFKRMAQYPELMRGLALDYGKNVEEETAKLSQLTRDNLESFNWIDPEIIKFSNNDFCSTKNVLNVNYSDLLSQDEEVFLNSILEFLDLYISPHVYESAVDALMRYRATQPIIP